MHMTNESNAVGAEYDADAILCTAIDIGEHLLKSGSEISRVENTIERICYAYGASHVEAFAIINLINASIRMPDGSYSDQIRRVKGSSNNFYKIEAMNRISRDMCSGRITLDEARERIAECKKVYPYPNWLKHVGAFLFVAGFVVFFGGGALDALIGGLIGTVVSLCRCIDLPFNNGMVSTVLGSFIAASLAVIAVRVGFGRDADAIITGTIMQVIPGMAFGISAVDLINGNFASGAMRLVQTLLTAVMIAIGYAAAFAVFGGLVK